ncbi:hypothetical protein FIU75_13030 [Lactobacillus buchneri]|nr:hypothetical protein [Lentilactobacillus buchneri]MQM61652.1 hypothetical protein [Lentilactobacillus buchneri]
MMFSVVTKYHKGRHSLFLYNSEIFYAFTQDILRSLLFRWSAYADLKAINRYQHYLKQQSIEQQQELRRETWLKAAEQGKTELDQKLNHKE